MSYPAEQPEIPQLVDTGITLPAVAVKRGIQTGLQGFALDISIAVVVTVAMLVMDLESFDGFSALLPVWGLLIAKSIAQALLAYVIRRFGDQSGFTSINRSGA